MSELKLNLPKLKKVDLSKPKKKKLIVISDDIRLFSGVSTAMKELVLGLVKEYDIVNIGCALNHPDYGKIFDVSEEVRKLSGVEDAHVMIYPAKSYDDQNIIRELVKREKPDGILFITDPRFYQGLFIMAHELRTAGIPLVYWSLWDCPPSPLWNKSSYESCDALFSINRQTHNMTKQILGEDIKNHQLAYIPHGINENNFFPIRKDHAKYDELLKFKKDVTKGRDIEFIVFFNSRNIRRKQIPDILLAYREFCNNLPKEKAEKCAFLLHTQAIDENGTDLYACVDALCPNYNIIFAEDFLTTEQLNMMYNISDVTINMSSNEGFGLGTAESLMAGTCIIANVTGGMQEQMGFCKDDGTLLKVEDYNEDFVSNHAGTYQTHGIWAFPLFPNNRSLQGSVPTPYIFDDRCTWEDAAEKIMEVYNLSREERERRGEIGRKFMLLPDTCMSSKEVNKRFLEELKKLFSNYKPLKRFSLYNPEEIRFKPLKKPGIMKTVKIDKTKAIIPNELKENVASEVINGEMPKV